MPADGQAQPDILCRQLRMLENPRQTVAGKVSLPGTEFHQRRRTVPGAGLQVNFLRMQTGLQTDPQGRQVD